MRHAGREQADSRQPLRADELLTPLVNLAIEVAANFLEAGRHAVEGFGQLLHFVLPRETQAVVEITLGDPRGSLVQLPQRGEDPDVAVDDQSAKEDHGEAGRPGDEPKIRLEESAGL